MSVTHHKARRLSAMVRYIPRVLLIAAFTELFCITAEPIPVRQVQGATAGFLLLKAADGRVIGMADEVSTVRGNQVRFRVIFRFRDGSIDDEASVFTQSKVFRLVSDHHIQKGPSFPEPLDMSIDVPASSVTWRETKDGKDKVQTEKMDLPNDLANGMTSLIAENFPDNCTEMKVPYLAGTSKPRLVTLSTKPDGEDRFHVAGVSRRSKKFRIHVEIGGVTGLVAPLIGKQPSDVEMWVTDGAMPTFLKLQGAFYENGPIWITQLTSPVW